MIVGIDPAPRKPPGVWEGMAGTKPQLKELKGPGELRAYVEQLIKDHAYLLIAWDAPLAFKQEYGYSDRPFDVVMRRFVAEKVKVGRLQRGAVSVRPFSGCPHWALTCAVLGIPFGSRPRGLRMAWERDGFPYNEGAYLVEVHPAVTLALWWLEAGCNKAMPRYKGASIEQLKDIARRLRRFKIPIAACKNDDALDAWVAWRMGADMLTGDACWFDDPKEGGYVLPFTAAQNDILDKLERILKKWRR